MRGGALFGVLLGAACANADRTGDFVVRDSAGISIATTRASDRILEAVSDTPLLTLGGPAASGAELFARVQGVRLDRHGRVWVVDGMSAEVRVFAADGTHAFTVGRRGSGPGEFQALRYLGELSNDEIVLWDGQLGRATAVASDGRLTSQPLTLSAGITVQPVRAFADGSLLAKQATVLAAQQLAPGALFGDTARLLRIGRDARIDTVGVAAGPTWLWTGTAQVPLPFTINTPFTTTGDDVLVADGPAFRIRVYRAGQLRAVFGVDRPVRAADDVARESYRRSLAYVPEPVRSAYLSALAHESAPQWLPGYMALLVAQDGSTWAQLYAPDPRRADSWDVYSPEREWLGTVRLPAGFVVGEVAPDRIAGVWYDADGVEHVRILQLERMSQR